MGMILVGAGLAVVSAGILIDGLQQQAQDEQQETSVNVMNDRVSDVAATGEARKLPTETLQSGAASVEKDTTSFELSTDHSVCGDEYTFSLNSFVYADSDRTWVLEGGGQWQLSEEGEAWVSKAPDVEYEKPKENQHQQLLISLVTFNESNIEDGEVVAKHSGEPVIDEEDLTETIRCPGGTSRRNAVWMNVTSDYINAWDEHLSEAVTGANVTYYGPDASRTNDDEINIFIDKLVRQRHASFALSGGTTGASQLVTFDDGLAVSPTVQNRGGTNGSTDVTLAINPEWTKTTRDLDPGDQETLNFDIDASDLSQIDGVDASKRYDNVSQYGKYDYNISTDSATAESGFFLSHSEPFYRLENVTHDKGTEVITVSAEYTNITRASYDPDLNFTLEGESTNGAIEINRHETVDVQSEAWNRSTFTININRSRLPYGQYNYTVEFENNHQGTCNNAPEACQITRQLTLNSSSTGGGISNVSEVRVDEPANVSVKVLGTEISYEDDDASSNSYNLGQPAGGGSTRFIIPDQHLEINGATYTDGNMSEAAGGGNYSFDLAMPAPSGGGTEPRKNPNGGWVDPDGSEPQVACSFWSCDWEWNPDELRWNETAGYDLAWESGTDYDWQGAGTPQLTEIDGVKSWGPVTATAIAGDKQVRFSPEGTHPVSDPHQGTPERHDLNTFGTQETVWDYDTTVDNGSVTIEATYWACDRYGFAGTDTPDGSNELYYHVECVDFDEDSYVQASTNNNAGSGAKGFMMTRDTNRSYLPDIEKGYPRQRSITEVFEDGTKDITLKNRNLTLGGSDFAFMMETTETHTSIQSWPYGYYSYANYWSGVDTSNDTQMNLAAWDIAKNERDSDQGDPNFNDVIGLVQIDSGSEYLSLDDPLFNATVDGKRQRITSDGYDIEDESDSEESDNSVDVRVDEIVIG
jgi:hypothetical protein